MRAHRKPELPGGDIWGTRWGSNWSNTSEAVEEALGTKSLRMLMGWEGVFPKVFQETRPIWGGGGCWFSAQAEYLPDIHSEVHSSSAERPKSVRRQGEPERRQAFMLE